MLTQSSALVFYADASMPASGRLNIKREILDETETTTRKRQRLDHLTQEEKILRRKLKNRVAAQSARDRKKLVVESLESQLETLKSQVEELHKSNERLLVKNSELEKKNEELQEKITEINLVNSHQTCNCVTSGGNFRQSIGYAWPISAPQQKRQNSTKAACLMLTLIVWMMWDPIKCKTFLKSSNGFWKRKMLVNLIRIHRQFQRTNPQLKWWGPQQNSWNPSMN